MQRTCDELKKQVHACIGDLVFTRQILVYSMELYYVSNVDMIGIQGSFEDWEHLFDGKPDADVQNDQILDCGDDEFVRI